MTDIVRDLRLIQMSGDIPPKGHPTLAMRAAEEIERLRAALNRIQDGLRSSDNAQNADTVGRAREIALAALNGVQTTPPESQ